MKGDCTRNYKIVGLSPSNTVVVEVTGERERRDTGIKPSGWGFFGLTRGEVAILRKGMTASGRDRR